MVSVFIQSIYSQDKLIINDEFTSKICTHDLYYVVDSLKSLEAYQISTSRCFYASPTYIKSKEVQKAYSVSKRVLSLPLYYDLKVDQVALICAVIQSEFLESEGQLG